MTPNEPHQNCMLEYIISKKAELQNKMNKMDHLNFYERKILNWVPGAQEKVETLKSMLQKIQDSDDGQSLSDLDSSDNERSDTDSSDTESVESVKSGESSVTLPKDPQEQIEFLEENYVDIYKLVNSISDKIKDFATDMWSEIRSSEEDQHLRQQGNINDLVVQIFNKYGQIPTSLEDDTLTPAEITMRNQYIREVNKKLKTLLETKQIEMNCAERGNREAYVWSQKVIKALADPDVKPEIERFTLKQDYQELQKRHQACNQREANMQQLLNDVKAVAEQGQGKHSKQIMRLLQNAPSGGGTKKNQPQQD